MHVKIGPYIKWWGPYQIADLVFGNPRPLTKDSDETWRHRWAERLGDWLAYDKHGNDSALCKLCNWIYNRRRRQLYVRVDKYDTWNMDNTLRCIIAPMLVQLQATKRGSPHVDDSDVPVPLQSTMAPATENFELDMNWHHRWNWVLNELIWVFSHDQEAEQDKFFAYPERGETNTLAESIYKVKIDNKGLDAYSSRVANAYRLFGKYYQALWD